MLQTVYTSVNIDVQCTGLNKNGILEKNLNVLTGRCKNPSAYTFLHTYTHTHTHTVTHYINTNVDWTEFLVHTNQCTRAIPESTSDWVVKKIQIRKQNFITWNSYIHT